MANTSITSSNSVFTIVVAGLYTSGITLGNYAVDDMFSSEAIDFAEVQMGPDGKMTAGLVKNPQPITVSFAADSPSARIFRTIVQFSESENEIFWMSGELSLPSIREKYTLTKGTITKIKKIPDGKKVLQPVSYTLTFERVNFSLL